MKIESEFAKKSNRFCATPKMISRFFTMRCCKSWSELIAEDMRMC